MSAFAIAEARSRKSRSSAAFMQTYALGRACGETGDEPPLTGMTATQVAGFIEGLASWRAQTAKPRDFVPYSRKAAAR